MNVEMMGVTFVRLAIDKTDYLVSRINDNDREPSWDGDIEVYRKAGDVHSKLDLILRVPVQIKGQKNSNLKKKTISYPVELSDLRNYLNEGGTTFIVVYINESGDKAQIYYETLLPFDLKRLIIKHGEQKTKNIKLKAMPKGKTEIADVFLFAATHIKKQRPAITCSPVSMEDLVKEGCVPELSFGYTCVPDNNIDPFDYMFEHDTYIYAKLPFGLELPVEHLRCIDSAETTLEQPICVGNRTFYTQCEIVKTRDTMEYHIGKCIRLILNQRTQDCNLTFNENGTLTERITDTEFMLQVIEAGSIQIGGNTYFLNPISPDEWDSHKIPERKVFLQWLKTVKLLLDKLGVSEDLNCDQVTANDEMLIRKLVSSVLRGEAVEWTGTSGYFPEVTIANLTFKLCIVADPDQQGKCRIWGYTDAPVGFKTMNKKGREIEVSYHVFLNRKTMLNCCNIGYPSVVRHLKKFSLSEDYSGALIWLLLEMLFAYDESKDSRRDILDGAIELADWLRENDLYTPQDLLDLNYYQAIQRSRDLNAREIQSLYSIIQSKPSRKDILLGSYLLLGDNTSARHCYEGMSDDEQAGFKSYPISRFLTL